MTKEEILKDIRSLMAEIDKCTEDLLMAWTLKDGHKIAVATSEMSKIMAAAHQELSFLYDYIDGLWKNAQGDELPEIDREVVALVGIPTFNNPVEYAGYKVVFAHRPNPKGTDVKFLSTGKVEHIEAKCYDKGGWNQPNVKFWLDLSLPVEEGGKDE